MPEPFEAKLQRIDKMNTDLVQAISDGDKTQMDAWMGTDVYKFFLQLWAHQDALEARAKLIKENSKRK